ncbi:MAG: methylamine utilization protein [Devosia sp.]|nr:methylamine utilization protein [Devosia sp.]
MRLPLFVAAGVLAAAVAGWSWFDPGKPAWSPAEAKLIASLSLSTLPKLPPDPSNAVGDDPAAAALGRALFFDTRLSGNGKVACASCHVPDRQFQDGTPLGTGMGQTNRRTMPIAGTAYSPWLFWDGRRDSQWAQALGPLESLVEHGADRMQIARLMAANYATEYEAVFGPLPEITALPEHATPLGTEAAKAAWTSLAERQRDDVNRVFANVGKAIAAFERTIEPRPTRFDAYADALVAGRDTAGLLTAVEVEGLRVFVGKGECTKCHNGPLFTDQHFHNTGVPAVAGLPEDRGRIVATAQVLADPFNCLGAYSDAGPAGCAELRYMDREGEDLIRAYKPPSLRGVAERAPYMHSGQIATLAAVLRHYNAAPAAPGGHSELRPMAMSEAELAALEAFLRTLSETPRMETSHDRPDRSHLALELRSITEIATGLSVPSFRRAAGFAD